MRRLAPDESDARFIRRVLIVVVIGLVLVALYRASNILVLAFGSILGAIVIRSLSESYERRLHLPHRLAVIAGNLTAFGVIALLVWLVTVQFGAQIQQFVASLPEVIARLETMLSQSPVGKKIVDAVDAAYSGSRVAKDVSGSVLGTGQLLLNVVLVIVGAFFLAADPTAYERGLLLLVPQSRRAVFDEALDDTAHTLRLWLRGKVLVMTALGVIAGVGLSLAGVPSSAALGLLVGISEFVPYIGPTVAMVPALGLALTGGPGVLGGAIATFVVVRLAEVYVLSPFVQQKVIHIPPALSLFAIIGIGTITGVYGLFFSGAIMVVVYSLLRSLYLREVLGEDVGKKRKK